MLSFTGALIDQKSPEQLIEGEWKEVSWKYELAQNTHESGSELSAHQIREISGDLKIHKAEIWKFSKNQLSLYDQHGQLLTTLTYYLKGRGNILELKSDGISGEKYEIRQLDNETLELFLSFDLQIRALVRLTFKKSEV